MTALSASDEEKMLLAAYTDGDAVSCGVKA
jgi:hypothetical protein